MVAACVVATLNMETGFTQQTANFQVSSLGAFSAFLNKIPLCRLKLNDVSEVTILTASLVNVLAITGSEFLGAVLCIKGFVQFSKMTKDFACMIKYIKILCDQEKLCNCNTLWSS